MRVYFDNAATTPIRKQVIDLMSESMVTVYGNPSSTHGFGRSAKSSIENARKSISKQLNCDSQEIIFTSGGTESDNSILSCAVRDLGVKKIISSPIEHHAVLETLEDLKKKGVEIQLIDLEDNDVIGPFYSSNSDIEIGPINSSKFIIQCVIPFKDQNVEYQISIDSIEDMSLLKVGVDKKYYRKRESNSN